MKTSKLLLLALPCALAFGQTPAPAPEPENVPPEVDQALRSRVNVFYQAFVTGKYRDAFQVVADDAQDAFLAADKGSYKSCETTRIGYSDRFTKATVGENCKGEFAGHGRTFPVTRPLTSTWKMVDGQWYWYFVKPTEMTTPLGIARIAPENPAGSGSVAIPPDPEALAKTILASVKVDKSQIQLRGYEYSKGELDVHNGMAGQISVTIQSPLLPGFTIKPLQAELPAGQHATFIFQYDPDAAAAVCGDCSKLIKPILTAQVRIAPTAQVFPITITFAIPPELEKQLSKH